MGEAFASGKISAKETYTLRDEEAKRLGISMRARHTPAMKRPASASGGSLDSAAATKGGEPPQKKLAASSASATPAAEPAEGDEASETSEEGEASDFSLGMGSPPELGIMEEVDLLIPM